MIQFDQYFSTGLKPPTSKSIMALGQHVATDATRLGMFEPDNHRWNFQAAGLELVGSSSSLKYDYSCIFLPGKEPYLQNTLSNENKSDCLGYVGDFTTQLHGD